MQNRLINARQAAVKSTENKQCITGIYPAKCKYCVKRKYKRNFLKKYWCSLNNELCGYIEVFDCKYEVKENDK